MSSFTYYRNIKKNSYQKNKTHREIKKNGYKLYTLVLIGKIKRCGAISFSTYYSL